MIEEYYRDFLKTDKTACRVPTLIAEFEQYAFELDIPLYDLHNHIDKFVDGYTLCQATKIRYRRILRNLTAYVCKTKGIEQTKDRINEAFILRHDGTYNKI